MKFNLRDLLWLTLSIAMLICLITTYRQLDSKTEELSIAKRSVGKLVKRHSWRFNRNSKKSFQSEPSPFSSGTPVAKTTVQKNEPEELGFVQQVECIEQELLRTEGKEKSHQQSIAVLASRNQQLKNAVLIAKQSKMESSNVQSFGARLHASLIAKLLSSDRTEDQLIALNHILNVNEECLASNIDYKPVSPSTVDRMVELFGATDNDDVKDTALRLIQSLAPDRTISLGYQAGEFWLPNARNVVENKIRETLEAKCDLEYDQLPLFDVIENFQLSFRIHVLAGPGVDEKMLVTFGSKGTSFRNALFDMLEKYNLTYVVDNESLKILTATDDSRLTTLVYTVSGLITEGYPSEKLVKVLEEHFGEAKTELVKTDELAVTASEQIHYKISKFLAQLND